MSKAIIGGGDPAYAADRALQEQNRADIASGELTMMQRRIRTFYTELTEVRFPEGAPSWALEWKEWLLTGTVVTAEVVEEIATEVEIMVPAPVDVVEEPPVI